MSAFNVNTDLPHTEIVFIDASLPDLDQLVAVVKPATEVVLLDVSQDGLLQIALALAGRSGIDGVHVLSHGAAGLLELGSARVTLDTLASYGAALAIVRGALAEEADLLLYGCDVAQGAAGQAFIAALARATGANVAASITPTGSALLGGDWELQAHAGMVATASLGSGIALAGYAHTLGLPNSAPTIDGVVASNVTTGEASELPDFTVNDANNDTLTVTLLATNGTINGLEDNDPEADGIQLSGSAGTINAALAAATFTADADGPASIDISVSDGKVVTPTTATLNLTAAPADDTAPTVAAIEYVTSPTGVTNADELVYKVSFSEDVKNVDGTDFTLGGPTGSTISVTAVDDRIYTVKVSGGNLAGYNGAVTLGFASGNDIADLAGNPLDLGSAPGINQVTYDVDNTVPTVMSIVRGTPAATNASSLTWVVTFSEPMADIGANSFAVTGTTASIDNPVDLGGGVYQVTVSGGDLYEVNGSVTLGFASGLADVAGNALASATPTGTNQASYNVDHIAPSFSSATVSGNTLVLTYDEDLDGTSTPSWESFHVGVGNGTANVINVDIAGKTVTLTLDTAVQPGQAVSIAYDDLNNGGSGGAIQDAVGNDAVSVPPTAISNITPAANHAPTIHDYISTSVGTGVASALPDYRVDDADGDTLTVTLSTTNGTLNGLVDADNATPGIQLTGSAASINAKLADATFTAAANGTASVVISVDDHQGGGAVTKTSYLAATSPAPAIVADTVPDAQQQTSDFTSVLTGADGNIYMAMTTTSHTLSVFKWDGSAWAEAATLEADGISGGNYARFGQTVPIGVDQYGKIHALVSLDNGAGTNVAIQVATYDGTGWNSAELETLSVAGASSVSYTLSGASVTVTSNNTVNISYHRSAKAGFSTVSGYHEENIFATNASGAYVAFGSDGVVNPNAAATATLQQVAGVNGHSFLVQRAADNGSLVVSDYLDGAYIGTSSLATGQTLVGAATDAQGALQVITVDANDNTLYLWHANGGTWTSTPVPVQVAGNGYVPYDQVATDNATGRPGLVRGMDGKIYLAVYEVDASDNFVSNKILTLDNGQWVDGKIGIDDFDALISPTFAVDASGNLMLVDGSETSNLPYVFGHYTDFQATPIATAPAFVSAAVDGDVLVLAYDQVLDAANGPAASAFTVTVGADTIAVTGVTVDAANKTVTLSLRTPVEHGQAVKVGYTDPSVNNDPKAIQDAAGNDAASLHDQSVTNTTAAYHGLGALFTFETASGPGAGTLAGVDFSTSSADYDLDAANVRLNIDATSSPVIDMASVDPDVSGYATGNSLNLGAMGETSTVYSLSPKGQEPGAGNYTFDLTSLTLINAVDSAPTQTLRITASNGKTFDVVIAAPTDQRLEGTHVSLPAADFSGITSFTITSLSDLDGHTAGKQHSYQIDNIRLDNIAAVAADATPPAFVSATVTGATLVLTYDEALDDAHGPAKTDFTVKVGGQAATVSNVTVDAAAKTLTLTLASAVHGNDVVTVSYTDSSGGTHAIQDAAGNDASGLSNHAVSNQSNDAPTIGNVPVGATAVVTGQASALPDFTVADADGDNLTVTLTATNGVINGLVDADPVTAGIQLSGSAATINAALAAATFTASANGAASIGISVTDGKVAMPATSTLTLSAAADTLAPRIASIVRATSTTPETNADTVAWDVTFNEAVRNVDPDDFEVDMFGTTVTGVVNLGNNVYRVTASGGDLAEVDGQIALSIKQGHNITDQAGNALQDTTPVGANEYFYEIDNSAPGVRTIEREQSQRTGADQVSWIVGFDETMKNVHASDFIVSGTAATVSNVEDLGNRNYRVTVSGGDLANMDGTVTLGFASGRALSDLAGNVLGDTTPGQNNQASYVIDNTVPTLNSAVVTGTSLVLTYDEALDGVTHPGNNAFQVKIDGTPVSVTNVAIDGAGKTVTLTLARAAQPGEEVKLSYHATGTAIQDVAGNDAGDLSNKLVSNNSSDTLAPTLATAAIVGDKLVLTYSEALDGGHKPGAGAFVVKIGSQTVNVTDVAIDGASKTVTLTLDHAAQAGDDVKVSYGAQNGTDVIQDVIGNDAAGMSNQAVTNNSDDTLAPALVTATIVGDKLVLTYDEALSTVAGPQANAFVVKFGSQTVDVTNVDIDGKTVTLTLDKVAQPDDIVKVSYAELTDAEALQDSSGNIAADLSNHGVTNDSDDTLAPTLQSASVTGTSLVLTYSEALDVDQELAAGAFVVTVGGETVTVSGAVVNADKTVTLTLEKAVQPNETVKVSYQVPASGGVVQDVAGNDAATVSNATVGNTSEDTLAPTLVTATIVGDKLVLTYDEALDAVAGPHEDAFVVEVGNQTVNVTHVAIVGKTVTLTLDHVAQPGDTVKVSYGELTNAEALQDGSGNIAAQLTNHAVTNDSGDTLAPTLQSARVSGATLVLEYNEALDLTQQLGAGAFAVKVGGQAVTVTGAVVNDDKTVTLTLDKVVQPDEIVKVSYQAPANGGVIQDAAGNDAAGVTDKAVTNNSLDTLAPTLASAVVTGTSLVLTYSEKLYPQGPLAGAFAVTVGGSAVGVTQATVNSLDGTVTLTLDKAVQPNQVVKVSYLEPTGIDVGVIEDLAGNDAASVDGHAVTNVSLDTLAPAMMMATVNGNKLVLAYGEALDTHGPDAGAFTVRIGGNVVAVTNVAVDSANGTVTLTLASAATSTQSVTVSYQDPTDGNDANAIQDLVGNDAASLVNRSVVNTTPAPTPPVTPPAESTVDGVKVVTEQVRNADGSLSTRVTIPVVTASRNEQVGNNDVADIPLAQTAAGGNILTAQLPVGFGLTSSGSGIKTAGDSLTDLIREIQAHTAAGSTDQTQLTGGGSGFIGELASSTNLLVQTIVPVHAGDTAPTQPLAIVGLPTVQGGPLTAIVLDGSQLPAGTHITLDNVDFAALIGAINVSGGAGSQKVWGDSASQTIFLGEGDDTLHGGGGDDIVGSAGGNDHVYGDDGDDIVFGGEGDDYVDGGAGHDIARFSGAGRDGYSLRVQDGKLVMKDLHGTDGTDTVVDVEVLRFTGAAADTTLSGTVARLVEAAGGTADTVTVERLVESIGKGATTAQVANGLLSANGLDKLDSGAFVDALYHNVLGRDADAGGKAAWVAALDGGKVDRAGAALMFADSAEKIAQGRSVDLDFNHSDVATLVRMYETLFARHADEGGLNFWIGLHESGNNLGQLADWFVGSSEAVAQYGALSDAQFVDTLYHTAFDRTGTAAEQKFWLDNLASGAIDRGDVLLGFAESEEMVKLVGAIGTSIETA